MNCKVTLSQDKKAAQFLLGGGHVPRVNLALLIRFSASSNFCLSRQLSFPSLRPHSRAKTNLFGSISGYLVLIYNLWPFACEEIDQTGLVTQTRHPTSTLSQPIHKPNHVPPPVVHRISSFNTLRAGMSSRRLQHACTKRSSSPPHSVPIRTALTCRVRPLSCCAAANKTAVTRQLEEDENRNLTLSLSR